MCRYVIHTETFAYEKDTVHTLHIYTYARIQMHTYTPVGLIRLLPVFLDHVVHPTLNDEKLFWIMY
jgi:hypothetical protein